MQLLKPAVCYNHIGFVNEGRGFVKQQLLAVKVLLEVIVAQLLVDFEIVGVAFACLLKLLPNCGIFGSRHLSDSVELILELAVTGECAVDIVGIFSQSYNLGNDSFLLVEVGSFLHFALSGPFGFLVAYLSQ